MKTFRRKGRSILSPSPPRDSAGRFVPPAGAEQRQRRFLVVELERPGSSSLYHLAVGEVLDGFQLCGYEKDGQEQFAIALTPAEVDAWAVAVTERAVYCWELVTEVDAVCDGHPPFVVDECCRHLLRRAVNSAAAVLH